MARFLQPLGPVLYQGLDVSELEGTIDFSRVRAAGKRIVYIRAGLEPGRLNLNVFGGGAVATCRISE